MLRNDVPNQQSCKACQAKREDDQDHQVADLSIRAKWLGTGSITTVEQDGDTTFRSAIPDIGLISGREQVMTEGEGNGEQQHQDGSDLLEQHPESELGNTAVLGRGGPMDLVHNKNLGMMLHTL